MNENNERGRIEEVKSEQTNSFKVEPSTINQELFQEERQDKRQEKVRKLILEAFVELQNHPIIYEKSFITMTPEKMWDHYKTVVELKEIARNLGGHMANWVEQALEWAQKIQDGGEKAWKQICNDPDTSDWYRLIMWKRGCLRRIGGSAKRNNGKPESHIGTEYKCHPVYRLENTVPKVVIRSSSLIS